MAKRFTDTGKWEKAWFRKLSPHQKCVWLFLCDKCDHAGIWEIDEESFEYFIGEPFSVDQVLELFGDKVLRIKPTKLLVQAFVDFQYGNLNPANRVHKSILNRVKKEGASKGLIRTLQGSMEMDMEMDSSKGGVGEKQKSLHPLANLWNSHCGTLKRVVRTNGSRLKKIQTVWPEHDVTEWGHLVQKVSSSSWCIGKNDRGWRATFDWFIKPDNVTKVLEGNYDNQAYVSTDAFSGVASV